MELTKQFIKEMNNLNQDVKNVFTSYYLTNDGYIFADKEMISPSAVGIHYGYTKTKLFDFDTKLISDNIFQAISKHKKELNEVLINENGIFLTGDNTYEIGSQATTKFDKKLITEPMISLSTEDIEGLSKYTMIPIECGKYRSRISKYLMPGLKKTHKVLISFEDYTDELFLMYIQTIRSTCILHHVYKCLYV